MKRRRSGTVSSIALKANSIPTSALIAANSAVDWSFGAEACRSRRASASPSETVSRPPAIRSSAARTAAVRPGRVTTSTRVTRPRRPLICCA